MKVLIKRLTALLGAFVIGFCVSCSKDETKSTTEEDYNMPLLLTNANVDQESRLSMIKANAIKENNGYLDSDEISLILELDSSSLIDEYLNVYSTTYNSIADYASSGVGVKKAQKIEKEQEELISKLEKYGYIEGVLYKYNTVMNGIAVKTTYGNLAKIDELDNVSHTYISETYNLPQAEEVKDGAVNNVVDVYDTGIFKSDTVDFDGEGTSVAILDSGFDISHEVFKSEESQPDPNNLAINKEDVSDILEETVAYKNTSGLIVDDVYKNNKVPFAFDYADYDFDVEPTLSNHGTHVAGIIGGYYGNPIETVDGSTYDKFIGVAPKTQLVLMKVFSDLSDGADTEDLLAGLEDAVLLGVDAINMSLGTSCGFSREYDNQALNEVYNNINNAGISLVVAASNSYSSGFGGEDANTNKVTNPESSTVGSPSTYYGALSVASISGTKSNYIEGPDNFIFFYAESSSYSSGNYSNNFYNDIYKELGFDPASTEDHKIGYVTVPGYGLRSNYNNIDVKGKIALVKRGDNTFEEKCSIAKDEGAVGIIIYNNVPGDITMTTGKVSGFPAISVTKDVGDVLAKNRTGELILNSNYIAGPFMSDFSSWGPTSDLKLKPEITAHGGNIVSAVPGGGYDKLSGTSMACPNMCGVVVLIRQYLKEKYPDYTAKQISDMAYQLLMSTATIALNQNGDPYSPRKQGAGLANLVNATTTGAYLTVKNNPSGGLAEGNRPKLELGDDKERKGVYEMTFNIVNISSSDLSYILSISAMTESVSTSDKDYVAEMSYMLGGDFKITSTTNCVQNGMKVTVKAGQTATITVTYTLSEEDKNYIDSSFPYGMYVEGFINLTADGNAKENITLNAPFLAFYGDWLEAPIFDKTFYEVESEAYDDSIDDDDKIKADYYATVPFGSYFDSYVISLGTYVYNMDLTQNTQIPAREDHIAISSNDGTINGISGIYTGLLRNVARMEYTIVDNVTGEVIYRYNDYNCNKAFNNSGSGQVPYFERLDISPIDLNLVNNREYTFTMQAYTDFGDEIMIPTQNVRSNYSFVFTLDDEAPIILGAEYEKVYDKTQKKDRYYVTLTVSDNQYVQAVTPIIFTKDGASYSNLSTYPYPVYGEKGEKATVRIEITDYMESYYFDDVSSNTLGFVIDDYALNSNIYLCSLPGTKGNLKFTQDGTSEGASKTQQIITAGEVVDLKEYLTSTDLSISLGKDFLEYLKWESSNPDVAIVDEGEVIGLKTGTTTISVSNPSFNVEGASLTVRVTGTSNEALEDAKLESLNFIYFDTVKGHATAGEASVIGNEEDRTFISSLPTNNVGAPVVTMYPGETIKLTYNIRPWYLPEDRYELTYSSTNENVATVTSDGEVSTLKEGSATIRLTIKVDGKQSNIMALLAVTVKDPFVIENRILNYYKGLGGEVIIPDDEGIMQIAPYAFSLYNIDYDVAVTDDDLDANKVPQSNTTITKVVIPEGVTTIGKMAFANLLNLETIILPSTVTTIEEMAFMNCPKLKNINLEHVTTIEYEAFKGCSSLETVDLSDVYSISYGVFEDCTSLNNVDITTLRSSGRDIFKNCTGLTTITISPDTKLSSGMFAGSGLTSITLGEDRIPDDCFNGCTNLTSVTFTNDLVYIGTNAFKNTGLTNIEFGGSVAYFYPGAFSDCVNLKTVVLPNSSFTLGDEAFAGDTNLTTLVFGANTNILSVGLDVFKNTNLSSFEVQNSSNYSISSDNNGVLLSKDGTKLIFVAPKADLKEYTVPQSVTEISEGAFANNASLETLTITNPNTTIGANAFSNCPNLTTINFPSEAGVKVLSHAFYSDSKLASITNLDKVSEIGDYAFANTSLTSASVSANVGAYAFANTKITSLTTAANLILRDHSFYANSNLVSVTLGDNNQIGAYAFASCLKLANINLEKAVNEIGAYAFYQDESLTKVTLTNVTSIGDYAFAECENLKELNLDAIETVGAYAFSKVESKAIAPRLSEVTFPETLKEIKEGAFSNLLYLTKVTFNEGLEKLGTKAFYGCQALTSVTLPQTLKEIGEEAFRDDTKLSSINLSSVTTIAKNAFMNTKALTSVDLANTDTINYGAFASSGLKEVLNANKVTYVGGYAFQNTSLSQIDLPTLSYLGEAAFSNMSNLTSFTMSSKISFVGNNAFYGSNNLAEFNYLSNGEKLKDGNVNDYAYLNNGVLYTHLANGNLALSQVPAALNVETLTIVDNTVSINPYAGNRNLYVKHLVFPDTLEVISNFAFYGYNNLESVEFRSYVAPKLESFLIENTEIGPTDPGYGFFNNAYHLFTNPYPYYQFINRVGSVEQIDLILPANDKVVGYDTLIYEGYFGDIENASRSNYVAKDTTTLAFLNILNKVPAKDDVTLDDDAVITEAVTLMNALTQDLTIFGYTKDEVANMTAKVEDARYRLYELKRDIARVEVRNVQALLDTVSTTFDLSNLDELASLAARINALSRDEQNILDMRRYNELLSSYNSYISLVNADNNVVDKITSNGYNYNGVSALLAATNLLGISLAIIFKGLL